MSKEGQTGVLMVSCACGLVMRGTLDVLVTIVQKHASEAHNMRVTREDVLAKAHPEE